MVKGAENGSRARLLFILRCSLHPHQYNKAGWTRGLFKTVGGMEPPSSVQGSIYSVS